MPGSRPHDSTHAAAPKTEWASVPVGSVDASGFTRSQEGLVIVYRGLCPRCQDPTVFEVARGYAGETTKAEPPAEFIMLCQCGIPHQGHPEGDYSCGAYWRYTELG
jgi:hypothetical protein